MSGSRRRPSGWSNESPRTVRRGRSGTFAPRRSARHAPAACTSRTSEVAVDRVVRVAIDQHCVAFSEVDPLLTSDSAHELDVSIPARLRRSDRGKDGVEIVSAYSLAGSRQYTSHAIVHAERRILDAAHRTGGRTISDVRVGIAVAEAAANGLRAERRPAVAGPRAGHQRPRRSARPRSCRHRQDHRHVRPHPSLGGRRRHRPRPRPLGGRRPRTRAHATGHADTLAKLVWHIRHGSAPDWVQTDRPPDHGPHRRSRHGRDHRPRRRDRLHHRPRRAGAAHRRRPTARLGRGRRGAARHRPPGRRRHPHRGPPLPSPRRNAQPRRGRSHPRATRRRPRRRSGSTPTAAASTSATSAPAPTRPTPPGPPTSAAGTDSILLAPTRELVAELNTRARVDRLAGLADEPRIEPCAHARRRHPGLRRRPGHHPTQRPHAAPCLAPTGSRTATAGPSSTSTPTAPSPCATTSCSSTVRLPADYVAAHVQLGLRHHHPRRPRHHRRHLPRRPDRRRGPQPALRRPHPRPLRQPPLPHHRHRRRPPQPHPPRSPAPTHRARPAHQILAPRRLPRLRHHRACATRTTRHRLLADAAARYHDALTTGAEHLLGPTAHDPDRQPTPTHSPPKGTLTDAPAWPTLRTHLALTALDGHDPLILLTNAVARRHARRRPRPRRRPRRPHRQPHPRPADRGQAAAVATRHPGTAAEDIDWGPFLTAHQRPPRTSGRRRPPRTPADWVASHRAAWARPSSRTPTPSCEPTSPSGAPPPTPPTPTCDPPAHRTIGAPGTHQTRLNQAVRASPAELPLRATQPGTAHSPTTVRADPWITPLCQRLARLERAGLPVTDYLTQARTSIEPSAAARRAPSRRPVVAPRPPPRPRRTSRRLDADHAPATYSRPDWRTTLDRPRRHPRADYLQHHTRLARPRRRRRRSRTTTAGHPTTSSPPPSTASPTTAP